MQKHLPGFIKTAEALQIKGLASVNNNNNNQQMNNNLEPFNLKYQQAAAQLEESSKFSDSMNGGQSEIKYERQSTTPPPSFTSPVFDSPPPTRKKRREDSPQNLRITNGSATPPPRLLDLPSSTDLPSPRKCPSSPLSNITDTIHSTINSLTSSPLANMPGNPITSVASMASVAKAISLSKLVHEISSQASIASLKSAALPPPNPYATATTLIPEDLTNGRHHTHEDREASTPPPQQPPPQMPSAHLHNTSEYFVSLV